MASLLLLLKSRFFWLALCFAVSVGGVGYEMYGMGKSSSLLLLQQYKLDAARQYIRLQNQYDADRVRWEDANQKVTEHYESLKVATATAVRALDTERMRLLSTLAKRPTPAPGEAQASPGADAGGETGVLTECVNRYAEVAASADHLAAKVVGLQDYVANVCLAP